MRTLLLAFVLLLSAAACTPDSEAPASDPAVHALSFEDRWDELVQDFRATDLCDAPGAVALVDGPGGRFLKAYGLASTEAGTPMTADGRFEIGSNTKSFTVVLALQLQEEGVWSLDDPLSRWAPEDAARLPHGGDLTLRHLASNTSGVWDYADPLIGGVLEAGDIDRAYTPDELVAYVVANGTPSFAPGEGAEYSSSNFILLGRAVEAATGEPVAALYQERIFDPLGMDDTSLLVGVPDEGETVNGYYTLDGEVVNVTDENGSQMWTAGGIVSTAEDLAAYAAALADGSVFETAESRREMTDFEAPVAPFMRYGLGLGVFSEAPLAWGHGGQTLGFQTLFAVVPEHDTNVVLLTNSGSCEVLYFPDAFAARPELFAPATE